MTDALLIKVMDSAHSSMSPVPSFSSLYALCSLPLKQSIHSSSKYFFLTSQEKSIMGRREGRKLGMVARTEGQEERKDQG